VLSREQLGGRFHGPKPEERVAREGEGEESGEEREEPGGWRAAEREEGMEDRIRDAHQLAMAIGLLSHCGEVDGGGGRGACG